MRFDGSPLDGMPLPWWVNVIADVAGIDAAMTLCLERGGTRFAVPDKASDSLLEKIVGTEAATAICAAFGAQRITVPLANKPLVFWLRGKGWSVEKISCRLRLSRRGVQYLLNGNTPRMGKFPE